MKNEEPTTFSDCLKEMQKKCSHPEVEEVGQGVVICMCCGKVLKGGVDKLLNNGIVLS